MIYIYRILYMPVLLILLPYYLLRMWRRGGYRAGFANRFGILKQVPPKPQGVKRIWLQAVSVGELMAIEPLLKRIHADSRFEVVLTTTTSTGFRLLRKRLSNRVVWSGIFPIDFFLTSSAAWRRLQPDLAILMEAELWPEHIEQARRRNIPVLVINGRVSEKSFKRHLKVRKMTHPLFRSVAAILASTDSDLERLRQLAWIPANKITLVGNLKLDFHIDTAIGDLQRSELLKELGFADVDRPVILLGSSTWPGEEAALVRCLIALLPKFPNLRLLLVPRHPERKPSIASDLRAFPLPHHFRSDNKQAPAKTPVYVADTIGELRMLTELADIVFIGSSLPPNRGGQTPIEAAALAKPLIFGPDMDTFRDLAQQLVTGQAAIRIHSESELLPALRLLLQDSNRPVQMGLRAQAIIHSHRGATDATWQKICELMH